MVVVPSTRALSNVPEFKSDAGPKFFYIFKNRLIRLLSFDFKPPQVKSERAPINREEIFTHEFIRYLIPPYNIDMAFEIARLVNRGNWYLSKKYVTLATQCVGTFKQEKRNCRSSDILTDGEASATPARERNFMQQASKALCRGNSPPLADLSFLENLTSEVDLKCLDDLVRETYKCFDDVI